MKYNEIKELTTAELAERLAEKKANYTNMKLTHTLSPLENPLQIRVARRTIARLSTELSSRSAEE
jgi:large subunit ribosomal protein L29